MLYNTAAKAFVSLMAVSSATVSAGPGCCPGHDHSGQASKQECADPHTGSGQANINPFSADDLSSGKVHDLVDGDEDMMEKEPSDMGEADAPEDQPPKPTPEEYQEAKEHLKLTEEQTSEIYELCKEFPSEVVNVEVGEGEDQYQALLESIVHSFSKDVAENGPPKREGEEEDKDLGTALIRDLKELLDHFKKYSADGGDMGMGGMPDMEGMEGMGDFDMEKMMEEMKLGGEDAEDTAADADPANEDL